MFPQSARQREQILGLILENERVSPGKGRSLTLPFTGREVKRSSVRQVDSSVVLSDVAKETDGFSGSDLRETCRDAALLCVREFVRSQSDR